jgi:hypothetical protein
MLYFPEKKDEKRLEGSFSDQDLHIPLLELHLGSQGIGAEGAEIFVLVPLRQDQEEAFANRDRPAAARTKKLAGFKLAEGRLGFPGWIRTSGMRDSLRTHLAPTIWTSMSM